jgi:hypothetical protein
MSTETLSGLRDYLFSTLSRSNMLWLATQLKERAEKEEELKPYTIEELHQMGAYFFSRRVAIFFLRGCKKLSVTQNSVF